MKVRNTKKSHFWYLTITNSLQTYILLGTVCFFLLFAESYLNFSRLITEISIKNLE